MKSKDQILLENAYQETKINALGGKVTLGGDVVKDQTFEEHAIYKNLEKVSRFLTDERFVKDFGTEELKKILKILKTLVGKTTRTLIDQGQGEGFMDNV